MHKANSKQTGAEQSQAEASNGKQSRAEQRSWFLLEMSNIPHKHQSNTKTNNPSAYKIPMNRFIAQGQVWSDGRNGHGQTLEGM